MRKSHKFFPEMAVERKCVYFIEHEFYPHDEDEERAEVRQALATHVEEMDKAGLVCRHTFAGDLGFSITLATVGNDVAGREYVMVSKTSDKCDLFPDVLKPGDELVCVNDGLIVLPDAMSFRALRDSIVHAPRPFTLTFIQGVDRDLRFAMQQAGMAPDDDEPPPSSWLGGLLSTINCGGCGVEDAVVEDITFQRRPRRPVPRRNVKRTVVHDDYDEYDAPAFVARPDEDEI